MRGVHCIVCGGEILKEEMEMKGEREMKGETEQVSEAATISSGEKRMCRQMKIHLF